MASEAVTSKVSNVETSEAADGAGAAVVADTAVPAVPDAEVKADATGTEVKDSAGAEATTVGTGGGQSMPIYNTTPCQNGAISGFEMIVCHVYQVPTKTRLESRLCDGEVLHSMELMVAFSGGVDVDAGTASASSGSEDEDEDEDGDGGDSDAVKETDEGAKE